MRRTVKANPGAPAPRAGGARPGSARWPADYAGEKPGGVLVEAERLAHHGVQQPHERVVLAADLSVTPRARTHLAPRQRQQPLQRVLLRRIARGPHAPPRVVSALVVRRHVVHAALARGAQQQSPALTQHVQLPRAHPLGLDRLREGGQRHGGVGQQPVAQRRLLQLQRLRVMAGGRRDGREGLLPRRERRAVVGELLLE